MTREPTFLFGVGATKAGTSWLYDHLAGHPDCHLRSLKELHYFDTLESGRFLRQERQVAGKLAEYRQLLAGRLGPLRRRKAEAKRRDHEAWLGVIGKRQADLAAYKTYLTDGLGQKRLVADVTPAYALLPVARLHQMAGIATDVRFLYLLRDPVARLWSQARMIARRAVGDVAEFPARATAEMRALLDRIAAGTREREDYAGIITRLRAAVAPERLMLMLQDEMLTRPGLARLCAFLGIRVAPADFDKRVLEGASLPLAEDLRARAQGLLRPQYEFVARLFPDLPESWRRNMAEVHG